MAMFDFDKRVVGMKILEDMSRASRIACKTINIPWLIVVSEDTDN